MAKASKTGGASKPADKPCAVTKRQFEEMAPRTLAVKIAPPSTPDSIVVASMKVFASGSFGWYVNEKITVEVDGVPVRVQCNVNMIVVKSAEADPE